MDTVDGKTNNNDSIKSKKAKLIIFLIIIATASGLTVHHLIYSKTVSPEVGKESNSKGSNSNLSRYYREYFNENDFFDYCLTVKNLEYKARQKYPDKQKVLDEWNTRIADLEAELPKIDQSLYPYYYKERTDEIAHLKGNIEMFNKYGYSLDDKWDMDDMLRPHSPCDFPPPTETDEILTKFRGMDISDLEYNGDYIAFKKDVHNLYTKLDNEGVFGRMHIPSEDELAMGGYGAF